MAGKHVPTNLRAFSRDTTVLSLSISLYLNKINEISRFLYCISCRLIPEIKLVTSTLKNEKSPQFPFFPLPVSSLKIPFPLPLSLANTQTGKEKRREWRMILVLKTWKMESYGFPLASSPWTKLKSPIKSLPRITTVIPQTSLAWRSFSVFLPPLFSSVKPMTLAFLNLSQLYRYMHAWPFSSLGNTCFSFVYAPLCNFSLFWVLMYALCFLSSASFIVRFFSLCLCLRRDLSRRLGTGFQALPAAVLMILGVAEPGIAGPFARRFINFSALTRFKLKWN